MLKTASPRNFLQWLALGGFCHLRNGRSLVNRSGARSKWRQGSSSADCRIEVLDEFSSGGGRWRRRALYPCTAKEIQTGPEGFFAWLSRLAGLEDSALFMLPSPVATVCTDSPSMTGWGGTLGDYFIEGEWPEQAIREGISWTELWLGARPRDTWRD